MPTDPLILSVLLNCMQNMVNDNINREQVLLKKFMYDLHILIDFIIREHLYSKAVTNSVLFHINYSYIFYASEGVCN